MPQRNTVKNKLILKVNRKGEFVSLEFGAGKILLEAEEAIEFANKIIKHADRILKAQ